jgi:hypothetical protein
MQVKTAVVGGDFELQHLVEVSLNVTVVSKLIDARQMLISRYTRGWLIIEHMLNESIGNKLLINWKS